MACEGAATEPVYFQGVADKSDALGSRLKLKVLPPREGNLNAPRYVLQQMNTYKKEFGIGTHDELCLVIDRDQQAWEEKAISEIAKACDQKQYLLALSNPAFDLWLLLHHLDVYALTQDEQEQLYANKKSALKRKIKEYVTRG
ncbi:RloB family protein [Endozoicomonas acroporae]|uniref:RloB family protein n=1 Tax=Endozoicomonas acroporae TaxID=1701104 RepID=UPI0023EA71C6|nr:RloB family protein [Endozoicomonas acroporae]